MAKLEKSFEDYFKIPILLRPVASTPLSSLTTLTNGLTSPNTSLIIDERYEPIRRGQITDWLQQREKVPQMLAFTTQESQSFWSEYEIIYQCRFVVGVYDPKQKTNLEEEWKKMSRSITEEGKKVGGLIIMTTNFDDIKEIQDHFIIIPEKINEEQIFSFLEPWLYRLLANVEAHFCSLIADLQKDENNFIVFNKHEERPEPKTLKRKKKGRCLKLCGDLCLTLQLIPQAYNFYLSSEEILKKLDDYFWLLGCSQGKLACFTTDFSPEQDDKHELIELCRLECLSLARRVRIPQLQTENYFKILKIYTNLPDKFDEMASEFLTYVYSSHNTSERFLIITQLAILYKEAGMLRKYNNLLYRSAVFAIDSNPKIVNILLMSILETGLLEEWPTLQAHVIKLLINNGIEPTQEKLHLKLLENCCGVLSERDIVVTLETLSRRNFHKAKLSQSKIIEIRSVVCKESKFKPKLNKIGQESPTKAGPGFFMNWRKKQTIYYYQQHQPVIFKASIENRSKFDMHCLIKLKFSSGIETGFTSVILKPSHNQIELTHRFEMSCHNCFSLTSVEFQLFNFLYEAKLQSETKIEIYEEYPEFEIKLPAIIKNEESSLFQFPLEISRNKHYLGLHKTKLNLSIFYTVEVGFQESQYVFGDLGENKKFLVLTEDYPGLPDEVQGPQKFQILKLKNFKVDKKYLKKIEIRLEAIRQESSKFQISRNAVAEFEFIRSIWCEVKSITTPIEEQLKRKNEKIIEDFFIVYLSVHKKQNNLTPYEIVSDCSPYTLSQETTICIRKTMKKVKREEVNQPIVIELEWKNLTRVQECGKILFELPVVEKMIKSDKKIDFKINNQPQLKANRHIKDQEVFEVSYQVSSINLNNGLAHEIIVQAMVLPGLRKYLFDGKKVIKSGDGQRSVRNTVKIRFFWEYRQFYLIGLKFQDGQIYWHPCQYEITHS